MEVAALIGDGHALDAGNPAGVRDHLAIQIVAHLLDELAGQAEAEDGGVRSGVGHVRVGDDVLRQGMLGRYMTFS